jgi:hypothetical protein
MGFGLKNVPPTYQWLMIIAFRDYFGMFIKLFLNDFCVFNILDAQLIKLQLCFDKCREFGISLNLKKCMFFAHSGVILGYVVSKEGKLLDPKKISTIVHKPAPKTPKEYIRVFNGMAQLLWPNTISVSSRILLSLWFPLLNYYEKHKLWNG